MDHTIALLASLASLGLTCALYYCNITARPGSFLRSEMLTMMLLAFLTGILPLAIGASLVGLWKVVTGGLSFAAILAAGADLLAIGALVIMTFVFRALVKATRHSRTGPSSFQPPARPTGTPQTSSMRKAA